MYHDRLTQIKERNGYSGVIDMSTSLYAQECHSVERSVEDLHQHIAEVLVSFVDGFEMRKSSYTAQLKRMREVSNNATRNAIQTCKMDATAALNHLKASLDREKEKEFYEIKKQLREAELNNGKFVNELANVRAQLDSEQAQVREQNYKMERINNEFVKSTEAAQSRHLSQLREEQNKFEAQLARERAALKTEHEQHCSTLATEHETQLLAQEKHFEEIRQMLTDQLREKDENITELKASLQMMTKQLAVEHENYNRNLADEQLKHDNALKLVHAENLRGTAVLKADIAAKIQQLRADELAREEELDLFVTKEKEKLVSTHVCELELYEHNAKHEMKRLQQHLENKQKEEFVKIKYMHELELTRALRENDRLNKLLIRATGASGSSNGSSGTINYDDSDDYADNRRNSSVRYGSTPAVKSRSQEVPPPPPPPLISPAQNQSFNSAAVTRGGEAAAGTSRMNKWSALNKSLIRDHDYLNSRGAISISSSHGSNSNSNSTRLSSERRSHNAPPPDDFAVDDALAHANVVRFRSKENKSEGKESNHGKNNDNTDRHVSANMGKVNSYMAKLQSYLEDYQDSPGAGGGADDDAGAASSVTFSDEILSAAGNTHTPRATTAAFAVTGSREDIERAIAEAETEMPDDDEGEAGENGDDDVSTADSLEDPETPYANNTTTYFSPDTASGGAKTLKMKPVVSSFPPRQAAYTTIPATAADTSPHNMTANLLGSSVNQSNSQSISLSSDARNLLGTTNSTISLGENSDDSDDGSFHLI